MLRKLKLAKKKVKKGRTVKRCRRCKVDLENPSEVYTWFKALPDETYCRDCYSTVVDEWDERNEEGELF